MLLPLSYFLFVCTCTLVDIWYSSQNTSKDFFVTYFVSALNIMIDVSDELEISTYFVICFDK